MDLELTLVGKAPLLMCNSRFLADPLHATTQRMKSITSKRSGKTEDDYAELARLEFTAGLYFDAELGPYMPGDNIFRMIQDSGAKQRLAQKVKSAVQVADDVNPLSYPGPRTVEGLWADPLFRLRCVAKPPKQGRVMRTRPLFKEWKTCARIRLDTRIISFDQLEELIEQAGFLVGIGDWRPRYGTFEGKLTAA